MMKHILFHIIGICIIMTLHLYSQMIDEQIKAIKNSPVEERFKRMNAFKKELVKMKEDERIEALKKLTKASKRKDSHKILEALKQHMRKQRTRQELENQHINIDNIQNETQDQNGGDDDDD